MGRRRDGADRKYRRSRKYRGVGFPVRRQGEDRENDSQSTMLTTAKHYLHTATECDIHPCVCVCVCVLCMCACVKTLSWQRLAQNLR